jgi:hypothetical protein
MGWRPDARPLATSDDRDVADGARHRGASILSVREFVTKMRGGRRGR